MAKKSTNKPWADRLREWEDQASAPLPPSGDWERLANKMALQEKRKRGGAYRWYLGLGLLATSLLVIYLLRPQEPSQETTPAAPIALQEQQETVKQPMQAIALDTASLKVSLNRIKQIPPATPERIAEATQNPITLNDEIKSKIPARASKRQQATNIATHFATNSPPIAADLVADSKNVGAVPRLATTDLSLLSWEARALSLPSLRMPILLVSPDLNQAEQKKWAIGPTLMLAQNSLSASSNSPGLRPLSSSEQQGLHSGLALSAKLGSRWGLQLGISRGREEVSSRYRFQRTYTLNNERTTTEGEVVNNFSVDLEGKYAKTAADVEISRIPNQPLGLQTRLLFEARLEEKVTITQVPLLLTYDLALGDRFSLRLGTGVSWQQNQITTEQQARLLQAGRFQLRRSRVLSRASFVEESLWMGQASLGLNYQLAERWSLIGQANAYTPIGQANTDAVNRVDYQGVGAQMQLLYHF